MASVTVNCSCGKQFVTGITSSSGTLLACPWCGVGHQIKPPGVPRDQFAATAGSGQVELADYYKVWSSTADGHSCSLCSKLEGAAVKLDKPFEFAGRAIQGPPLHNDCRCNVLLVHETVLEPLLIRLYNAFIKFSNAAGSSVHFQSFVSCFFAAEYFLGQLTFASGSELAAAGLPADGFKSQLRDLHLRRDRLFNAALKRAYAQEIENAKLLETERGRRSRMDRWLEVVVASNVLAPANYEYLKELISNE